jgi:hypothetical protein
MVNLFRNHLETFKNYKLTSTIIVVIVIMFLLSLQGFDVVDEGWYLTSYQQFFNHPETVEYNFVFYLTSMLGGLWYELFPFGGILSFRILAILCIVSTILLCYNILSNYVSKSSAVLGLLMVLFVNDFGYVAFYYNHLSSLLAVVTVFFLLKGTTKDHLPSIVIAGFITAINVFTRLPNITLIAFSLVFPLQSLYSESIKLRHWIKQLVVYIIGVIFGFCIMYFVLIALGHLEIMNNAILSLVDKGQNAGSNHNFSRLLMVYLKDYGLIIKAFVKISLAFLILVSIRKLLFKRTFTKYIWYVLSIVLFALVFRVNAIYTLYALSIIGCLVLFLIKNIPLNNKLMGFLALIMMLFIPLGSDGGINNVGYVCVWLGLPIFINILYLNFSWKIKNISLSNLDLLNVLPFLIVGFFLLKLYKISNNAYFDSGNRFEKTYSIKSEYAKGVFTTKERAEIFNELLVVLKAYVDKDDYLLAYDKIPMVNFLTNTKPYMYISWVWVYDGITFEKQIKRAENEIDILPIVVQQKFETIVEFSEPVLDYMSEDKEENYSYNKRRVVAMNDFLKRNNYEIVWSNTHFNIYKAKGNNY